MFLVNLIEGVRKGNLLDHKKENQTESIISENLIESM